MFSKYQGFSKNLDHKHYDLFDAIGGLGSSFIGGLFGSANTSQTNNTNLDIAKMNMNMQMANLEYQKALQQQIFERSDTAYQRTLDDMSKAGLNPLTMQNLNETGEAINTEAPQLNMKYDSMGLDSIAEMVNGLNNIFTEGIQRDGLRLQNKSQELDNEADAIDNMIKMEEYGITKDNQGNLSMPSFEHTKQEYNTAEYDDKRASADRNQRENEYQENFKTHDNSPREELLLTAAENQLENNNPLYHAGKMGIGSLVSAYNVLKNPIALGVSLIGSKAKKALKKSTKKATKKQTNRNWSSFGSANW